MTNAEIIIAYVSQVLNGHDFHFIDVSDLMAARKERIWITEAQKARLEVKKLTASAPKAVAFPGLAFDAEPNQ